MKKIIKKIRSLFKTKVVSTSVQSLDYIPEDNLLKWKILKRRHGLAKFEYFEAKKADKGMDDGPEPRLLRSLRDKFLIAEKDLVGFEGIIMDDSKKTMEIGDYPSEGYVCKCGEYARLGTGTCDECYQRYSE